MSRFKHADTSRTVSPAPTPCQPHPVQSRSATTKEDVPDFRVAIDFGTTFTTIAFTKGNDRKVRTLGQFPGDSCVNSKRTQVPSEISYLLDAEKKSTWKLGRKRKRPKKDSQSFMYGYEMRKALEYTASHPDRVAYRNSVHVDRVKLLLDESQHLKHMREKLNTTLRRLLGEDLIKKAENVIRDLLICYFRHTKQVLEEIHGLSKDDTVEITFCVPVCWSWRANAIMAACIEEALKKARLGLDKANRSNLFMVNEAEAAAVHALDKKPHDLRAGNTFIVLDCGGGTTDVAAYMIARDTPLRLGTELSHPTGAACGSADVNERMRKLAMKHLSNEYYLEHGPAGMTIASIVDAEVMPFFENQLKRRFRLGDTSVNYHIPVRYLRESPDDPMVQDGGLVLAYDDMLGLFKESFDTITNLLTRQIIELFGSNVKTFVVVLVGGFGDSPALKQFLRTELDVINKTYETSIQMLVNHPDAGATGVARGAVLRSLDKSNGPRRIPRQSIGIYRHVPCDSELYPADVLKQSGWQVDKYDGELYLRNTIEWVIKAGAGELAPFHESKPFKSIHCFTSGNTNWIAEEVLFASETAIDDFYTRNHPKNHGLTSKLGRIEFNVNHLRDRIRMKTKSKNGRIKNHFEVVLMITFKVIGRHLEFAARWAGDGENGDIIRGSQAFFNLVSAFEPGTK